MICSDRWGRIAMHGVAVLVSSGMLTVSPMTAQQPVASVPQPSVVARDREVLARPVTLTLDKVSLRTAITAVSQQTGVLIEYRAEAVAAAEHPVTVHATRQPLGTVLEGMLTGSNLRIVVTASDAIALKPMEVEARETGGIAGVVTDARTKQPLRGATVALDDTVKRVVTDEHGHYQFLNVVTGSHHVTVRFVGYARQALSVTVAEGQVAVLNCALQSSVNTLDQVVVTVTGTQRYRELGHVVSVINADSLVRTAPITNIADLLTARVPGLQVVTSGGSVGGDIALRIRGQTTTSLDPQPIVIVDGVRYKNTNTLAARNGSLVEDSRPNSVEPRSPLNDLNVNDIATVEVVKGPSATTLYGPDAVNGVIVITTKRGTSEKTEWRIYVHPAVHNEVPAQAMSIRAYRAWGHNPTTGALYPNQCNLVRQYQAHVCVLDSVTVSETTPNPGMTILRATPLQGQIGASVGGGANALRYFLSSNYDTESGPVALPTRAVQAYQQIGGSSTLPSALKRPNVQQSVDLHSNVSSDFQDRGSLSLVTTYSQAKQRNIGTNFLQFAAQNGSPPAGKDTAQYYQDFASQLLRGVFASSEDQVRRVTGVVSGMYHPFAWLTATAQGGVDIASSTDVSMQPYGTFGTFDQGQASDYRRNTVGHSGSLGLVATTSGIWTFRSSLGGQYTYQHLDGINLSGSNLAPGSSSIATASSLYTTQVWDETATLGTYGEEVVGWSNRVFLDAALRVDGSTSYGDDYHPRAFPKVGVSWVASDEPWLRNAPGIDQLRFRTSWGGSSRAPTSAMKLGVIGTKTSVIEGNSQVSYHRSVLANPLMEPERTQEFEYGLDATMFASRLDVEVTGYHRRTDNQINMINEPTGLPFFQYINLGEVTGHGFEAAATFHAVRRLSWTMDIAATYASQTTRLVKLGDGLQGVLGPAGGFAVGYPLGGIFASTVAGYADTAGGHADSAIVPSEVILSPVHYLGVATPPRTMTLSPSATFLHGYVRVAALFDRASGFIQADPLLSGGCAINGLCLAGITKSAPLLEQAIAVSGIGRYAPGDFTRWREFSITTNVPLTLTSWLRFGTMQVSVQGRNLALWTKFKSTDPESQPGSGILPMNGEGGAFGIPYPRTWSLRFDVLP